MKAWLHAFRLRTLPLSLSGILLGSMLAWHANTFYWNIFVGCLATATLLQVLSNLANDYGDFKKGTDNDQRKGPTRSLQSGAITPNQMMVAIILCIVLTLSCGLFLLYSVFDSINYYSIGFFALGLAAIAAAIKYTMGSNPYGYSGYGDAFVFIFFGPIAVIGSYYLHTQRFAFETVFPSLSLGFFSTAVLNVNNIRDIESDALAGKITRAVKLGKDQAIYYHGYLLAAGFMNCILYQIFTEFSLFNNLVVFCIPIAIKTFLGIKNAEDSKHIDPYLKQTVLMTLLFTILFCIGLFLQK